MTNYTYTVTKAAYQKYQRQFRAAKRKFERDLTERPDRYFDAYGVYCAELARINAELEATAETGGDTPLSRWPL